MRARKLKNIFMTFIISLTTGICLLPLFLVLYYLFKNGISSLNIEFFLNNPKPIGEVGGGMANAIVGSLIVIGLSSLIGIPSGLIIGIFLGEFGNSKLASIVRLLAEVLQGLPSIVIGIIAYSWIVKQMGHFSALAGSIALSFMMIPIIARSTEEVLILVPNTLKEASLALGAPRWRTMIYVTLRTSLGGVIGGILSGIARISGETAPLLFTAFGNRFFSTNILKPISTLTLQIFEYARSPYDELHRQAWAGAIVLVFIVFLVSLLSKIIVKKLEKGVR